MGERMKKNKFDCLLNPFGTLFNPHSIAKCISYSLEAKNFTVEEFKNSNGLFFHYDFHSELSYPSAEESLHEINKQLKLTKNCLKESDYLFITFGTAWVYRLKENAEIVANCYKQPPENFDKELLDIQAIYLSYKKLIPELISLNPKLKIIFTLSPVRHLKDGFHENQLSKSTLLLAIEKILGEFTSCSYFPAYEILMDDLRDYRFYAEDLVHPNQTAINYIWQKFSIYYFTLESHQILEEIAKINASMDHRAFNPQSKEHQKFLKNLQDKIKRFSKKHQLNFSQELKLLEQQTNGKS